MFGISHATTCRFKFQYYRTNLNLGVWKLSKRQASYFSFSPTEARTKLKPGSGVVNSMDDTTTKFQLRSSWRERNRASVCVQRSVLLPEVFVCGSRICVQRVCPFARDICGCITGLCPTVCPLAGGICGWVTGLSPTVCPFAGGICGCVTGLCPTDCGCVKGSVRLPERMETPTSLGTDNFCSQNRSCIHNPLSWRVPIWC